VLEKVIVVYESKYGNTKLVAETIIEGMGEVPEISPVINELKELELNQLIECAAILEGSPNHIGNTTRGIRKFIDKLRKLKLEGRLAAIFGTYLGGDFEKVVKKMEERISEKALGLKLAAPGLPIE
jgi:NAD(P)H dehydrogenase (quinone)